MAAFSDVNGEPASASQFLLHRVLRDEWKFSGLVVSDAKAVVQLENHGIASDDSDAARQVMLNGLDVELIGWCYSQHLASLVEQGKVPVHVVDEAVARVLRVKMQLGLFDRKRIHASPMTQLPPEHLKIAREFARQSIVLLKNDNQVLPLKKDVPSIAVIGPLADDGKEQMGAWAVYGKPEDTRTALAAIREAVGAQRVRFVAGLSDATTNDTSQFADAIRAARECAVAVVFAGEPASYSGEAHNRAFLTLPGAQCELVEAIADTGTPTVVVLMAGRPLELHDWSKRVGGVMMP